MYQGLGSVLLGGLAVSTIFTIFVIPAILIFVIAWKNASPVRRAHIMRILLSVRLVIAVLKSQPGPGPDD